MFEVVLTASLAEGASGFFFPFFDYIVELGGWWSDTIAYLYNELFEFLSGAISAWIDAVNATASTTLNWLGMSGEAIVGSISGLIETVVSLPTTVLEWIKGQAIYIFAGVIGDLETRMPEGFMLSTDEVAGVQYVMRQLGYFVDYNTIIAMLATTLAVNGALVVAKIIWRSIPAIG